MDRRWMKTDYQWSCSERMASQSPYFSDLISNCECDLGGRAWELESRGDWGGMELEEPRDSGGIRPNSNFLPLPSP